MLVTEQGLYAFQRVAYEPVGLVAALLLLFFGRFLSALRTRWWRASLYH